MKNNPPWQAEISIDQTLLATLISKQFPNLVIKSIQSYGQGWDNKAFLVNQQWLFRLPTRQLSAKLMDNEIQLLPILKGQLPLSIPVIEFVGQPSNNYPWGFAGYSILPGMTACHAQLNHKQRRSTATRLAQFLKTLHSQSIKSIAKTINLPGDAHQKSDPMFRTEYAYQHLASIEQRGLVENRSAFDSVLTACKNLSIGANHVLATLHFGVSTVKLMKQHITSHN